MGYLQWHGRGGEDRVKYNQRKNCSFKFIFFCLHCDDDVFRMDFATSKAK